MEVAPPTVLVVEDEPLIRLAIVQLIEDAGFHVHEAAAATAALSILEDVPVRVVVTDVRMPGKIDGLMLAAHVRERWPKTRVILTSAHVSPASPSLPPDILFLPKPFRAEVLLSELTDLVREESQ